MQWIANFAVSATFPGLRTAGLGLAYGLYARHPTPSPTPMTHAVYLGPARHRLLLVV
jgi:hypothetical protein